MATFMLVHGAWHGAWCWHKVVSALSAQGHRAVALDLPSHGANPTPITEVTLQAYADRICRAIDAEDEAVVLVGHSMGGLAISQAAEHRSEQLRCLVYLTAMLPAPGDTAVEPPDSPAVQRHLVPALDGAAIEISAEGARGVFFHDCSEDDVSLALERLCPQATGVFDTALELSDARFGKVARYYIECQNDKALTPAVQRRYYQRVPCRKIYALKASHSPFFSKPQDLSDILCEIAGEPG